MGGHPDVYLEAQAGHKILLHRPAHRLSIITPVHPPRSGHLAATAASVAQVRENLAATGTDVEWVVAIDGPGDVTDVTDVTGDGCK